MEGLLSAFIKTLCASGITLVMAMPAFAQQAGSWEMEEGTAHVVDMQGKMKKMQPSEKTMTMMKQRAKPVPKGTIIFKNNGQLYMMQGSKDLFNNF
jgi:hypothetical protein